MLQACCARRILDTAMCIPSGSLKLGSDSPVAADVAWLQRIRVLKACGTCGCNRAVVSNNRTSHDPCSAMTKLPSPTRGPRAHLGCGSASQSRRSSRCWVLPLHGHGRLRGRGPTEARWLKAAAAAVAAGAQPFNKKAHWAEPCASPRQVTAAAAAGRLRTCRARSASSRRAAAGPPAGSSTCAAHGAECKEHIPGALVPFHFHLRRCRRRAALSMNHIHLRGIHVLTGLSAPSRADTNLIQQFAAPSHSTVQLAAMVLELVVRWRADDCSACDRKRPSARMQRAQARREPFAARRRRLAGSDNPTPLVHTFWLAGIQLGLSTHMLQLLGIALLVLYGFHPITRWRFRHIAGKAAGCVQRAPAMPRPFLCTLALGGSLPLNGRVPCPRCCHTPCCAYYAALPCLARPQGRALLGWWATSLRC